MEFSQAIDVSTPADLLLYSTSVSGIAPGLAAAGVASLLGEDRNRIALILSGTQLAAWGCGSGLTGGSIFADVGTPIFLYGAQYIAWIGQAWTVTNRGAAVGDFHAISFTLRTTLPRLGVDANELLSRRIRAQIAQPGKQVNRDNRHFAYGRESAPLSYPLDASAFKSLYNRLWRERDSRRWRNHDLSGNYANYLDS